MDPRQLVEEFESQGFARVSIFDDQDIDFVARELTGLLLGPASADLPMAHARRELALNYAKQSPSLTGKFSLMSSLLSLAGLASRTREIAGILGLAFPVLASPPEVRTDFPGDSKYSQQWHVDWPYAQTSLNSLTIWTPLHDVKREDGALKVLPGSHMEPIRRFFTEDSPRKFLVDAGDVVTRVRDIEVRKGESLVFSQNLIHSSGWNTTNLVRLSFQIRIADVLHPEWVASRHARGDLKSTSIRPLANKLSDP